MKKTKATNPQLIELGNFLRKQSTENNVNIWQDIAERLSKPRRNRATVNVSRLNRHTKRNEIVAVAGKVLAAGEIGHPLTVAAFTFSEAARQKIIAAKGKCVSFSDLIKKNPKGSNVRIIG